MNDSPMHMRIVSKLPDGRPTASIYRRSGGHACDYVATVILEDLKQSMEAVADAVCAALDEELAARRVN